MRQQLFDTAAFAHRGGMAPRDLIPAEGRLFDPAAFPGNRPSTAEGVRSVMGGRQMGTITQPKMFMTPTEIHAGWSPLDGDRMESYDEGSWGRGSSQYTKREYNSQGEPNSYYDDTTGGGAKYRRNTSGMESDEQLWDRKLDEAHEYGVHGQYGEFGSENGGRSQDPLFRGAHSTMGPYMGSASVRTGASEPSTTAWDRHYDREASWDNRREAQYDTGSSLAESIRDEGVRGPIRLGQQIGSMGKPQIVGGHHRLAAATHYAPNRLVPVLHDWSIQSARDEAKRGGYPYA